MPRSASVLDVGCGMGGSSLYLARSWDCNVTGITLSKIQQSWARAAAVLRGVAGKTRFLRQDVENSEFGDEVFDFLWSIECAEHLFDKPAFFQRLKHDGGVALCVWHAGDGALTHEHVCQIEAVCHAFLCPSLGTVSDYTTWLGDAGLEVRKVTDLTSRVIRTWEVCQRRVQLSGVSAVSGLFGKDIPRFLNNFQTILQAYRSGAMKYCSIVATKP